MRVFLTAILVGGIALPVAAEAQGAASQNEVKSYVSVSAPVVALTHVRVIDGTGAPAADDQTVVISNGRIMAVGPAARVQVPQGAQVIAAAGKTVTPGFYGMHDHLFYPAGGAGGVRNHHPYSAPRM